MQDELKANADSAGSTRQCFKNIWFLTRSIFRRQDRKLWFAFLGSFLASGLREVTVYFSGLIPSYFYGVFLDWTGSSFLRTLTISATILLSVVFATSVDLWVSSYAVLRLRSRLTLHFHDHYIDGRKIYDLQVSKSIDNPDQRITVDIPRYAQLFISIIKNMVLLPILVVYYSARCWVLIGYYAPLIIYSFFIVGTLINRVLINRLAKLFYRLDQREGDFRYHHVHLRDHAEQIIYQRGQESEKNRLNAYFRLVYANQSKIIRWQYLLNLSVKSFEYFGTLFSYFIIGIPFLQNRMQSKTPAEIGMYVSQASFLNMYLLYQFTQLVDLSGNFAELAGSGARLAQLLKYIQEKKKPSNGFLSKDVNSSDANLQELSLSNQALNRTDSWQTVDKRDVDSLSGDSSKHSFLKEIRVSNLTVETPDGKVLVRNLSFQLQQGQHLLVLGATGCGKTAMIRVLAGIWPSPEGHCQWPTGKDILYLTTQPYLIPGLESWSNQVCYPDLEKNWSLVNAALEAVDLAKRDEEIYFHTLSNGEKQKLMIARALYHTPKWVVLDEALNALSEEEENHMLFKLAEKGISCIVISHRFDGNTSRNSFYDHVLGIDSHGDWKFE